MQNKEYVFMPQALAGKSIGIIRKKTAEQFTRPFPVFPVDAIFHPWRIDFTLYEPRFMERLEML